MIQRGKLVLVIIISIVATIVAGVNIKQAVERQMDKDSLIEEKTAGKIEIQDIEIERHSEKENNNAKNIDEAVTTIDEVEADEQGQLAANAGGSGEAEIYETGEEDIVVGKDPSLVENEDKSETGYVIADSITVEGGTTDVNEAFPDTDSFELPSEEEMQEAWDLVEQNNTNLH